MANESNQRVVAFSGRGLGKDAKRIISPFIDGKRGEVLEGMGRRALLCNGTGNSA
jgi:hypothetical protein